MSAVTVNLPPVVPAWILVLRILVSGLYRLAISGGTLFIIFRGVSAWVILAALPLLILGPRSR